MNQQTSQLEIGDALSPLHALADQPSVSTAPKAAYETPELTSYGKLHHLTLQGNSGGIGPDPTATPNTEDPEEPA